MPILEWDSKFVTGIEEIDEQHKELFKRLDKLELTIYSGNSAHELLRFLEYLDSYIIEHFEAEEKLMLDNNYPDFAKHLRQHQEFRSYFSKIITDSKEKGADSYLAIEVNKYLRKWWENHITKVDMEYVPYIKGHLKDKL